MGGSGYYKIYIYTFRIAKLSIFIAIDMTLVIGGVRSWITAVIIAPANRIPNMNKVCVRNMPTNPTSKKDKISSFFG